MKNKSQSTEDILIKLNKRISDRDVRMKKFREKNSKIDILGSRLN